MPSPASGLIIGTAKIPEHGENPAADAKVGMAVVGALDRALERERDSAKLVRCKGFEAPLDRRP
jgi:hypothetical protein